MAEPFESLRGNLLIASPALFDPNFRRTVVLVTEHNADGAMGVVLNRPSTIPVCDAVEHLARLTGPDELVHVGGPVQPEAVVALAELDDPAQAAAIAFDNVGYLRSDVDPDEVAPGVRRARVYAGYSGWSSGQLEAELDEDAWIVEPATVDDVFTVRSDALWSIVLRRKGGQYVLLATMPPDPTSN